MKPTFSTRFLESRFSCRSDAKSARQSTCQQLRSYVNVPMDGWGAEAKKWRHHSYREVKYDVVIINGPCRELVGRKISFWTMMRECFFDLAVEVGPGKHGGDRDGDQCG